MKFKTKQIQQNNYDTPEQLEETESLEQTVSKKNQKKQKMILLLVITVSLFLLLSFAWYLFQARRKVNSDEREVMPPYCLYLVEPNGTDTLQLTVGNLHPGETKQIVVGVTNKAPDGDGTGFTISRDSDFNYELELAYTENLPVTYQVYELTKAEDAVEDDKHILVEWTDANNQEVKQNFTKNLLQKTKTSDELTSANNSEMYGDTQVVNLGQYDVYDKTSGGSFDLTASVEGNQVQFDLDYYLIEIQWKDGITFSDYLKETDLVYVMVKALQLEPKEKTQ